MSEGKRSKAGARAGTAPRPRKPGRTASGAPERAGAAVPSRKLEASARAAASRGRTNPLGLAQFTTAAHELRQLPADCGAEVAFAGRSNAGKSSAINALTGNAKLARTSKTPGRTQQLVIFALDADRRLVDLPGYGYAQVPEDLRAHWRRVLDQYFRERQALRGLVLAMDSRHPLTAFDTMMLEFCASRVLPCHVLLTKADKLSRSQGATTLRLVRAALPEGSSAQLFSAHAKTGLDEARAVVLRWLDQGDHGDEQGARVASSEHDAADPAEAPGSTRR